MLQVRDQQRETEGGQLKFSLTSTFIHLRMDIFSAYLMYSSTCVICKIYVFNISHHHVVILLFIQPSSYSFVWPPSICISSQPWIHLPTQSTNLSPIQLLVHQSACLYPSIPQSICTLIHQYILFIHLTIS